MVWFFLPESLAPTQLSKAKVTYNEVKAQAGGGAFAHLVSFLAPLKLFVPVTVAKGDNPLKRRKDWNLTLLVVAHGFILMLVVSELSAAWRWYGILIWSDRRGLTRSNFNTVDVYSDLSG